MTFVTIGIPFYNAESTLQDAIRSVFAQTHQEWELLLVDDGSTDHSLEIARSVNDLRVRVISDGQNLKLAARLNQITREAQYDFIIRMDADDMMAPGRIEKEIAILEQNNKIDLVATGIFSLDNNDLLAGVRLNSSTAISKNDIIWGKSRIVHPTIAGRRNWFLRNPYDETFSFSEDAELWHRTAAVSDLSIYIIHEPLLYYREISSCVLYRKFILAHKYKNIIHRRYKNKLLFSRLDYLKLLAIRYFKFAATNVLFLFGCQHWRLNKRNREHVSSEMQKCFNEGLEKIRSTFVPGFSSPSIIKPAIHD